MNKSITMSLATLGLLLSQAALAQPSAARVQTLRGADAVAADQAPVERKYAGRAPGSQKSIPRTFTAQPQLIPHAIEESDEVTLQDNRCISCHGLDNYRAVGAPRVAASHLKEGAGNMPAELSGARYQCTACHVPQVDAKPLVQNTFKGVAETKKKK